MINQWFCTAHWRQKTEAWCDYFNLVNTVIHTISFVVSTLSFRAGGRADVDRHVTMGSYTNGRRTDIRVSDCARNTRRVISHDRRNIPSTPNGPIAATMLCVRRNGTRSGQVKLSPCKTMITHSSHQHHLNRTWLTKDTDSDSFVDSHRIINRWKNYFTVVNIYADD